MGQLLQIDNVVAVDTFEDFGQLFILAKLMDDRLDLMRTELSVGEHSLVRCKGAEDAVAAESHNAMIVLLHGAKELVDGRFILEEFGLVLGKK